MKDKKMGNEDR